MGTAGGDRGQLGWKDYCQGQREDAAQLVPFYIRPSYAEEKRLESGQKAPAEKCRELLPTRQHIAACLARQADSSPIIDVGLKHRVNHFHHHLAFASIAERLTASVNRIDEIKTSDSMGSDVFAEICDRFRFSDTGACDGNPGTLANRRLKRIARAEMR